jgi:hypothetical protein
MQCNVTWQTTSEYRRLTVPSGRTLNYISFVRKIQSPEIFGSPLVHVLENIGLLLSQSFLFRVEVIVMVTKIVTVVV